jgi:hypothetical protein
MLEGDDENTTEELIRQVDGMSLEQVAHASLSLAHVMNLSES